MTDLLPTIDRLRPEPQPLDPQWSADTLREIVSAPSRVPRRHRVRLAAGAAAAVMGVAGAAYATGLVPDFVTEGFDQVSDAEVVDPQLIADVRLPDGRRVGVWTGTDEDGEACRAIADDWDGRDASLGSSFECGSGFPTIDRLWTSAGFPSGELPPPAYLVVFGETPDDSATRARVTGPGVDLTAPVDPVTGGFGAPIPLPPRHDTTPGPVLRVDLLDATGDVVATTVLRDS